MSRLRFVIMIIIITLSLGGFSSIAVADNNSSSNAPVQAAPPDNPTSASDTTGLSTDVPPATDVPPPADAPTQEAAPTGASQPTSQDTATSAATEPATSAATMTPSPTGPATAGRIVIRAHACPATESVAGAAGSDLATACTSNAGGTVFDLAGTLGASGSQTVGSSGGVEFDNLPADTYTIVDEHAPADSSLAVFCANATDGRSRPLAVTNGAITFDLAGQEQQTCDWYIGGGTPIAATVPATVATPHLRAKNQPSTGSLQVNVYGCPEGYTQNSPDPAGLARYCVIPQPAVAFTTLSNFTSTGITHQGTTTGSPSFVRFDSLPTGTLSIREDFPAGYTSAIVYCRAEGTPPVAYTQYRAVSGGDHTNVYWGTLGAQNVSCDWYNVPAASTAPGTVYVNMSGCPVGYLGNTVDPNDYVQNCRNPMPGVNLYTESRYGQYAVNLQGRTAGNPSSYQFTNVHTGTLKLSMDIASGYSTAVAFCKGEVAGQTFGTVSYRNFPVSTVQGSTIGSIGWGQLYPGQVVFCDMYEVLKPPSTAYGTVYISMHGCPASLSPTSDANTLAQKCQAPMTGVTVFAVTRYNQFSENLQGQTSGSSNYQFTNVHTGDLTVSAAIPTTYGTPVVFCKAQIAGQTYGTVGYKQFPVTSSGGYANIAWGQLIQEQAVFCDWYQLPHVSTANNAANTASTVRINVWRCPDGTALTSPSPDEITLKTSCTIPMNGVRLNLSKDKATRSATSAGGTVSWGSVGQGSFLVRETSPAGIGQMVVFCGSTARAAHAIVSLPPVNETVTSGAIAVTIARPQTTLTCDWFNLPSSAGSSSSASIFSGHPGSDDAVAASPPLLGEFRR